MKKKRALRRHHDERWKNRVKDYWIVMWNKNDQKEIGKVAAARKCGCGTCRAAAERWGRDGSRAYEKRKAQREIDDQLS